MWHRDLPKHLAKVLPRWRWKSRLTHRGGTIEGESQKQNVRVEITHARGRWTLKATGLVGHKQPQTALEVEGTFDDFSEMLVSLLVECM